MILAGLAVWLTLPAVPSAFVAASPAAQGEGELDSERRAKLDELLARMKSGAPFSLEEAEILRRYAAGQTINRLTADTLISRALYLYFVTHDELTREQEDLLARYSAASATREHDLADRKRELFERRKAAAEASPPVPSVAPSNDLCSGAEVIAPSGPFPYMTAVTADITDATTTNDPPNPNCTLCGTVSRSIWYRFTPTLTASYTISTCQLDGTATTVMDTEMAIYTSSTGNCSGVFTQLPNNSGITDGCDSDSCVSQAFQSSITTQLNAGTDYFILVWLCESAPPVMGETAVQLLVNRIIPPANDTCASAATLTLNFPVTGTTVAATNDYQLSGASCFTGIGNTASSAPGRDVVYSFTAPSTSKYSFRVSNYNASLDPTIYIASTCPAATPGTPVVVASCVGAANRTVPDGTTEEIACVNLSSGQQVFLFVDENFLNTNTGSTFIIEVQRCTQEVSPNDTPATANSYSFGMEGAISPAGDADFISLGTVAANSRVFALVDGAAGSTNDFDLRITTTTDTLEYDDNNLDAQFGRFSGAVGGTPTPGSQIFARINHHSAASQSEPYRFYAVVQPPSATATPESEPNDTIAVADTASNRYFSGSLSGPAPSEDLDIFSFTATAGEVIFLGLDSDPLRDNTPINARLALLDASGNLLVQVNDLAFVSSTTPGAGSLTATTPHSPAEALVFRVPASGTFYARVAIGTSSVGTFGAGDYLLSITTGSTGLSAVKFGSTPGASIGKATRTGDGVVIEWGTAHEVNNLGFNLYRVESGQRTKVNSRLIAGSALMVGPRVSLESGHSYNWLDKSPGAAAEYWIEDVGLDGRGRSHGPIKVEAAGKSTTRAMKAQSVLLSGLTDEREGASQPVEARAEKAEVSAAAYSQDNIGARPAIKIAVRQEGLYRVTLAELVAAGLDPNVNTSLLQLFADGQEQPVNIVSDRQGRVSVIEFYGLGVNNAFTDARVYWLVEGASRGRRMDKVAAGSSAVPVGAARETIERKDRLVYFASLRNGEKENFFGDIVESGGLDQSLALRKVNLGSASAATLEVALQGVTLVAHRVEVRINGARAGELSFDKQSLAVARFNIPHQSLKEGVNIVRLTALGGTADASLVNYVRLTHSRRLTADGNSLRVTHKAKQAVTIDGFSSGHVRVFDVTDPNGAYEILGTVRSFKTHYGVSFVVPGLGERRLIAMTDDRAGVVSSASRNEVSNWRDAANEADLVVITKRDFFGALEPLKLLRQSQGLKVALVDIEDVYDEFSFGQKTPRAIRDFLAHARSSWKAGPRFALFAGDATYDPKNYLGRGSWDLIPTKLIDTASMETASDDWLVDFDSNSLPDIPTGRLPVRTASAASTVISKIIAYDAAAGADSMLLVTDANDGFDFESTTTALRLIIPPGVAVEEISRGGVDGATARSLLLGAINRGQKVVNYIGHGSTAQWRGSLLTSGDAAGFTNSNRLSLFIAMTCLNGYFHDTGGETLGESMLKAERGGAVAVWASTGMTDPRSQTLLNQELFRLVFSDGSTTLGEALARAKAAVTDEVVRRTWILLGDPTTRLR